MPFSVGSRMACSISKDNQISHAATALAYPSAFGSGQGAFYRVVGEVAVGHTRMEEHKEVAIAIVLHVA